MEKIAGKNSKNPKTKLEISSGGVVYNRHLDKFLLIKDSYNRWALPKGKIEPGEKPEETAVREIGEETGIFNSQILKFIGKIKYFYRIHNQPMFKIVYNFLLVTEKEELNPHKTETKGAAWFDRAEAIHKIAYKNAKKMVEMANNIIEEEGKNGNK